MCGENLKKALRVNREIADKKNETIFAAKRAAMGDSLPSAASASATATSAEPVEGTVKCQLSSSLQCRQPYHIIGLSSSISVAVAVFSVSFT